MKKLQQCKTSSFFNFFKNFVESKQKMSQIISHFRISLDLFELATFDMNYGLQTANDSVPLCPKVALRYFVALFSSANTISLKKKLFFLKCWYIRKYGQKTIFSWWLRKNIIFLEMLIFSEISAIEDFQIFKFGYMGKKRFFPVDYNKT